MKRIFGLFLFATFVATGLSYADTWTGKVSEGHFVVGGIRFAIDTTTTEEKNLAVAEGGTFTVTGSTVTDDQAKTPKLQIISYTPSTNLAKPKK